ncbi:methyl-accepting chemotaxis protein [Derxia gummosa]|uniref:Methyl-accepting chemotaxis protein n=1 Tax=Derxia gummosa DSM 723 TaxID=1121388 RepID=A0A9U5FXC0_9BURK|nr:methyl-accepting chemotaxis protein [Derxia gummosa]
MEFLSRFSVRTRLFAGFAFALLAIGMGIVAGISGLNHIADIVETTTTRDAQKVAVAQEWKDVVNMNYVRTQAVLASTDKALIDQLQGEIKNNSARATDLQQRMTELVNTAHGKELLDAIGQARNTYRAVRDEVLRGHVAGTPVSATERTRLENAAQKYMGQFDAMLEWQNKLFEEARASVRREAGGAVWSMVVAAVIGATLSLVAALLIARSIVEPLARVRDGARRIAAGDLGVDLHPVGNDEAAEMTRAIAAMQSSLRKLVGDVRSGVQEVTTASAEIANGSADLSRRTEQQASNLEQTSASMEEFNSAVQSNAEAAREASSLVDAATDAARRGGEVTEKVVSTMAEISESSRKIADIIGVIDGIAFQTNILALNAAVEAARAGEQGRGFAVVASEVRTLAQRSAQAAREIKSLIEDSVSKVETGGKLVNDSGAAMSEIVRGVNSVSAIMERILGSTMEQAAGIKQVSAAINQLDDMTQQNAALVEQSTAAADSLRTQAVALGRAVDAFQASRSASEPVPHAAPKAEPHKPAAHHGTTHQAAHRSPAPTAHKPAAHKPVTHKPAEHKTAEHKPVEHKASEPKAAEHKPAPVETRIEPKLTSESLAEAPAKAAPAAAKPAAPKAAPATRPEPPKPAAPAAPRGDARITTSAAADSDDWEEF